ncbi:MAG: M23 family metallopeptidase [Polaribacter sp.]
MTDQLIPTEEVKDGALSGLKLEKTLITLDKLDRIVANASYTTPTNNGNTETKTLTKNKVKSINIDKEKIVPNEVITYTVKLDEKDKDKLETELDKVKFCFWLQDKDNKSIQLEVGVGKAAKAEKTNRNAIKIVKRGNLASEDHTTDFLDLKEGENFTKNIHEKGYYYAKVSVDKEKKEVTLEIKYSKWMDMYKVRVEAYMLADPIKADGGNTTASRWVKATPEILDAYWMNAAGQKVKSAGYTQDLYIYIKTLGLKDKEIELQIHDEDYYDTPINAVEFPLSKKTGDELIEWKNNQIKIDTYGEALKQFKVGNKKRYEEAQKDEKDDYDKWYDDQISQGNYLTGIDPSEKYNTDLELYIHFPEKGDLKLDKDNQFAKLTLTEKTMILDAYFAIKKKEKVQADAPATKKNPNPTSKVTYYQKLDKGVLRQTVQLVAECPNLEGKKVTFQVFEKKSLLVGKNEALHFIHEKEPKCRIEAKVKEGFAVAEVKLQHCKEDTDNEDWLDKLKNGYDDDDSKTAQLYLKVEATQNVSKIVNNGEFLKDTPFKMIGNNWHEPVEDPQIAIYSQNGHNHPYKNTYGKGRDRLHAGLDIFALEGSNVYACLDAVVIGIEKWTRTIGKSGYGHQIKLKVLNHQEFHNRKREYTLAYDTDIKKGSNFEWDSETIYFRYAHLLDILVKKSQIVRAGDIIGKTGVSGVIAGTKDPHLHFNISSKKTGSSYLVNPAYYVYWKEESSLTEAEKKIQTDRKNEGFKPNPAPKLSKIE